MVLNISGDAIAKDGLILCLKAESGVYDIGEPARAYLASVPVCDRRKVHETELGRKTGYVAASDVIGIVCHNTGQKTGGCLMPRIRPACRCTGRQPRDLRLSHQPLYTFPGHRQLPPVKSHGRCVCFHRMGASRK